jgi:cold shock CspA family protein
MQATVREFDAVDGSGSVFLDDGTVYRFGPEAFAASGLRLLRRGQRVAIRRGPSGAITALTLATLAWPDERAAPGAPAR